MQTHPVFSESLKLNSAVIGGALMTFLLFYFMQALISTENTAFREPAVTRLIDATVPEFEQILIKEILRPEPIDMPDPPMLDDPVRNPEFNFRGDAPLRWETVAPPVADLGAIPMSRQMVPLIRTTATYPARALSRGIEGFVELSFTVDAEGRVVNPVVLHAEPEGMFERAALQAIAKWQYSPAVEDGQPMPVHDVRQRIVFQMSRN